MDSKNHFKRGEPHTVKQPSLGLTSTAIPPVLSNGARLFVGAGSAKSLANWRDSSPKSDNSLCRAFRDNRGGPIQSALEAGRPLGSEKSHNSGRAMLHQLQGLAERCPRMTWSTNSAPNRCVIG